MRKIESIICLLFIVITLSLEGCKRRPDYFVITEQNYKKDSIGKSGIKLKALDTFKGPQNWYTNFIIVLDSTDKVFIYQTEAIKRTYIPNKLNDNHEIHADTTRFSNYIGLLPEHLICFKSKDFIGFIKDNWDIFELDTTRNDSTARIITIASTQDTIKNIAFYDLQELTSMYLKGKKPIENMIPINENKNAHHSICIVRMTTEEENAVIYKKKRNLKYTPETIKWSRNFISGKHKPFTKEYDSEENKMETKQRAIFGIKKLSRKVVIKM